MELSKSLSIGSELEDCDIQLCLWFYSGMIVSLSFDRQNFGQVT